MDADCRGKVERIGIDGSRVPGGYAIGQAVDAGERLHRAFRPTIAADYRLELERMLSEGAGLTHLVDGGEVRALALWRVFHTTYCGRRFEVDDLVTDDRFRSLGHGRTLLTWLERKAARLGCPTLTLNSATHRTDAHRFYYRERYAAIAFHFSKALPQLPEGAGSSR